MISDYPVVPFRGNCKIIRNNGIRISSYSGRLGSYSIALVVTGLLYGIAALLFPTPLMALNPSLPVSQYLHTSWTQEEGSALPPVQALAQSGDGYLWLGTGAGLIRFDGMRFTEWSPLSGPGLPPAGIRGLRAASGGRLWI